MFVKFLICDKKVFRRQEAHMEKIRLGIIGGGIGSYIGKAHRIAACMDESYTLIGGIFSSTYQKSLELANNLNLDTKRIYEDIDSFIKEELALPEKERIEAVTIAVPNHLHYEIAKKLIENKFHVICEKPVKIYGSKAGLRWDQVNPTYLYYLQDDKPLQVLKPGYKYTSKFSLSSTRIAPGHPEGFFEAFANLYKGAAKAIRGQKIEEGEFPTIHDGVRGIRFIEAVVKSSKEGNIWVSV